MATKPMEYEITDGRRGDETLAQQPPRESSRVRRPPYRNSGYKPSDDARGDSFDDVFGDLGAQGLEPAQRRIALGFRHRGETVRWGIAVRTLGHGAPASGKCWRSPVSQRRYDMILHEGAFNVQLTCKSSSTLHPFLMVSRHRERLLAAVIVTHLPRIDFDGHLARTGRFPGTMRALQRPVAVDKHLPTRAFRQDDVSVATNVSTSR